MAARPHLAIKPATLASAPTMRPTYCHWWILRYRIPIKAPGTFQLPHYLSDDTWGCQAASFAFVDQVGIMGTNQLRREPNPRCSALRQVGKHDYSSIAHREPSRTRWLSADRSRMPVGVNRGSVTRSLQRPPRRTRSRVTG